MEIWRSPSLDGEARKPAAGCLRGPGQRAERGGRAVEVAPGGGPVQGYDGPGQGLQVGDSLGVGDLAVLEMPGL